jgi:hypothetical protein
VVPSLSDDVLGNGLKPVSATLTVIYLEGNPAVSDYFNPVCSFNYKGGLASKIDRRAT